MVPTFAVPDYLALRTEEDYQADVADILSTRPEGKDLWMFAYGSLLWKPTFDYVKDAAQ
jgi:cation transport protein ChaC